MEVLAFFLLVLGLVSGQSDFLCPPNNKMGLCQDVSSTCFDDRDCNNDEICCPEACTRTCKPKMAPGQSSQVMAEVPDLLNDPRVYIGKCQDSSCYSLFSSEPNQCSTSNLCRPEQFCCHDGCKNVCKWKPQYAAIIAKHEARVRYQQQVLYQKQQAELRKKQEAAYREQQRKLTEMEQARRAAKARAEAEAVLAAQKAKAQYQAQIAAASAAQAKAASKLQQQMAQQQAAALLQQQQQQQQQQPTSSSSTPAGGSAASPTGTTATRPGQSSGISLDGFFSALKKDSQAGTLTNQINSPANVNPYTVAAGNMNSLDKGANSVGGSAQSYAPGKTINSASEISAISSALARLIVPANQRGNQYGAAAVNRAPPTANRAPPTGNIAPSTFTNQAWSGTPSAQQARAYSYQSVPAGVNTNNVYSRQQQVPQRQLQQRQQQQLQQRQQQQQGQQPVSPFLMYHFMQAA